MPMLEREAMTPAQRNLASNFDSSSLNKGKGPIRLMLRSPEAARHILGLGAALRTESVIPPRLSELLVLVHARLWDDQYEWMLHARRGVDVGLSPETVSALQEGKVPQGLLRDEQVVLAFTIELETQHRLSDATYTAALELFGEQGVAELAFWIAQYCTVSMILAVAPEPGIVQSLSKCSNPFAR
jgi:4-carboxymuconolactone decarboxylase